jgi:RNA polymerase sigma-B factor
MPTSSVKGQRRRTRRRRVRSSDSGSCGSRPGREPIAREELIEQHLALARKLARRYWRSSVAQDDLAQVASVGLVKAANRFDADRGSDFAAFAVPTILGELKRYFRDCTWALHVTRRSQERALAVSEATTVLSNRNGRAPTVHELAGYLELDQEEVLDALQAGQAYTALSLEQPSPEADNEDASVATAIGAVDERYEQVEARLSVAAALPRISDEERRLLRLRFVDELTQNQIAQRLGVSQMQVSRRLRSSLERLRAFVCVDEVTQRDAGHATPRRSAQPRAAGT